METSVPLVDLLDLSRRPLHVAHLMRRHSWLLVKHTKELETTSCLDFLSQTTSCPRQKRKRGGACATFYASDDRRWLHVDAR